MADNVFLHIPIPYFSDSFDNSPSWLRWQYSFRSFAILFPISSKMKETEKMAAGVNIDSDEYRKLGNIWDSYLTKTGRCEREIDLLLLHD